MGLWGKGDERRGRATCALRMKERGTFAVAMSVNFWLVKKILGNGDDWAVDTV